MPPIILSMHRHLIEFWLLTLPTCLVSVQNDALPKQMRRFGKRFDIFLNDENVLKLVRLLELIKLDIK